MADKPDPDKLKGPSTEEDTSRTSRKKSEQRVQSEPVEDRTLGTGPGGMTMRELHELVKRSHLRDQAGGKAHNKLSQPQSRWQRLVRYVWDKNRGRG